MDPAFGLTPHTDYQKEWWSAGAVTVQEAWRDWYLALPIEVQVAIQDAEARRRSDQMWAAGLHAHRQAAAQ